MSSRTHSFLAPLLVAAALHAALVVWLAFREPPRDPPRRRPTVVRLATRPPPQPPPPPPAPPRVVEEPRPPPPQQARPLRSQPPQASRPPPPAASPPPPSASPAPRRFAVSMDGTAPGGSVPVPVTGGSSAPRGDPRLPPSAPVGDNPPGPVADVLEVDRPPRLVGQPSAAELRALYPPAARREGLEADVRVEMLVSDRGEVERVRLVAGAGNGFDEAAKTLARRMRFEPARRGAASVAVWIAWTWKFRLDG